MSTRPSIRKRRGPFDRHWPYPNPAIRARQLLGPSRASAALRRLIAAGDPKGVWHWMQGHEGPFELFNLLQLGLGGRPPADDPFLLFDEVPVATLRYADAAASADTLYARRTVDGFAYRVWSAPDGACVHAFTAAAPLTRPAVRRLFRRPAWRVGDAGMAAGLEFHDPARGPWDPDACPARFGGWDLSVDIESDGPAPCPACGYDLNRSEGDFCAHYLGSPDLTEEGGHWAGGLAIYRLAEAIRGLEEAAADIPEGRWAGFLRSAVPPRLRAAADNAYREGWGDDWQSYLGDLMRASPTYLGGYGMEKSMMPAESWYTYWDTMARTRARAIDRRLRQDCRAMRAATKAARALARRRSN